MPLQAGSTSPASGGLSPPPTPPPPGPADGKAGVTWRRAAERVAIAAAIAFGIGLRVWILTHRLGALDSDEAVVGLMAHELAHGQFSTFFWGQDYGGPVEAALAAALFAVVKPTVIALKSVPLALSAAAALLTWRIGRRIYGPPAGRWAGVVAWVWPPAFVWWSTKVGVYWGALCLALVVLLELCRLAGDQPAIGAAPRWELAEAGLLGLATGLAWWANPQTLYLMVPAYLWFTPGLARLARRRWPVVPVLGVTALAGAAPWIRYNLVHHWASLHFPPQPAVAGGYLERVREFFTIALPMALGLRVPYTEVWVPAHLAPALYAGALAAFGAWLALTAIRSVRRGGPARPSRAALLMGAIALAYPFLYAISPFSWFVLHPRYLLFLSPVVAIAIGSAVSHWPLRRAPVEGTPASRMWAWPAILAVAVALSVAGTLAMDAPGVTAPYAPDVTVPADTAALTAMLARYGVHDAFSDYWLSYMTTYETQQRTLVSPTYVVRDPALDAAVRASPDPAYLFVSSSATLRLFESACAGLSDPVTIHSAGGFTLAEPAHKVLPEQLGAIWQPGP